MRLVCDRCLGVGWHRGLAEWPDWCSLCHSRGTFNLWQLSRLLQEDYKTVNQFVLYLGSRSRVKTRDRILTKLLRIVA